MVIVKLVDFDCFSLSDFGFCHCDICLDKIEFQSLSGYTIQTSFENVEVICQGNPIEIPQKVLAEALRSLSESNLLLVDDPYEKEYIITGAISLKDDLVHFVYRRKNSLYERTEHDKLYSPTFKQKFVNAKTFDTLMCSILGEKWPDYFANHYVLTSENLNRCNFDNFSKLYNLLIV